MIKEGGIKMSFETNLKELEGIVAELEGGSLSLEESITKFEKGMNLSKECTKSLEEAEKKINILTETDGQGAKEKEFEVE